MVNNNIVNKSVRIIPNENNGSFPSYYKKCDYHQLQGLIKYIIYNDISVTCELDDTMTIAKDLASQGFCIILETEYNENKIIEIFLPEEISHNQLTFFEKDYSNQGSNNCTIAIYKVSEDKKLEIVNKPITEENMQQELIKELNNRLVKNEQKKLIRNKKN